MDGDYDDRLRMAAMAWLRTQALTTGGPVTSERLRQFVFEGQRVPLVVQQGIRTPQGLDAALTISTTYQPNPALRPYADDEGPDGLLRYKWRGQNATHWDNRSLRNAMVRNLPLIYFVGIAKGLYLPTFPVYLVAEEPEHHQFSVALSYEESLMIGTSGSNVVDLREYIERISQERLHQPVFRARVLSAYGCRCALCRLAHPQLLDAAHIIGDANGGQPVVTNGISMCKLHHSTYDSQIVGISPDFKIEVREDILHEVDGPTLQHSIKELHGSMISLPSERKARPSQDALASRYELFKNAS